MFGKLNSVVPKPVSPFGLPSSLRAVLTTYLLALSSPDRWTSLLDQHVGMALQKEATKQRHWSQTLGAPKKQFQVKDGQLHMGDDARYDVQLLGLEGMDAFLWAWALTDDMKATDPTLQIITSDMICLDLKENLPADEFPEFHTADPIPLNTTHHAETFSTIALGVLQDTCRAIYQVPDHQSGLIYYWMIVDERYPLEHLGDSVSGGGTSTTKNACALVSAMVEKLVNPHASHRVTSPTAALTAYAEALGLRVIQNDDGSQLAATPANVFWGDSIVVFCDPHADKLMGLSAQYDGALHTTWIDYDENGNFDQVDKQPSLDLATALPLANPDDDDDDDDADGETRINDKDQAQSINGRTS